MLLVKTKIGQSAIHGTGLFADQFIPEGTVTWQYDPLLDVGITKAQLEELAPISKEFLLYYAYYDKARDLFIIPTDHLKFINHSKNEEKLNIASTPDQDTALRDIQPGEELLCDYYKFDDSYFSRNHLGDEQIK